MVSAHSGAAPGSREQAGARPGPVPAQAKAAGGKAGGGGRRLPAEVEAEDAAELATMRQAGFTRPGAPPSLDHPQAAGATAGMRSGTVGGASWAPMESRLCPLASRWRARSWVVRQGFGGCQTGLWGVSDRAQQRGAAAHGAPLLRLESASQNLLQPSRGVMTSPTAYRMPIARCCAHRACPPHVTV